VSVAKGTDVHLIYYSEKKLLEGLVGSIVLFLKFHCGGVLETSVGNTGYVAPSGMMGSMHGLVGARNGVALNVL